MDKNMARDKNISLKRNSDHYDHITHAWQYLLGDNFHWGYFEGGEENLESATDALIEQVVHPMNLNQKSRLLDVGCGIGNPSRYIAKKYDCSIVGFSTSNEGIKQAVKLSKDYNSLEFFEKNALDNEFEDESFSSVMLLEMSHLIQDKARLIAESSRVLEVGGTISLCDLILQKRLSARDIVAMYDDLRLLERSFGKARLETLQVYSKIFQECGLEIAASRDITKEVTPTLMHWKENALRNSAEVSRSVSQEDIDCFITSCDLLEKLYKEGVWGYGLISARKIDKARRDSSPTNNPNLY